MVTDGTRYTLELVCSYPDWWRFNLYMMVVGFDKEGNNLSFTNFTDRVYDLETGAGRTAPEGYDPLSRRASVESPPCDYIEVYVYAVANTFPDSDNIKDSPPFEATLRVSTPAGLLSLETYQVNQWGGLTVVGKRFGPVGE